MNNILNSIKQNLGISEDCLDFDSEIISYTNMVFFTIKDIYIATNDFFILKDGSETWDMYTNDEELISLLIPYITLKVKLLFDPPNSSSYNNSINTTIKELEWRLFMKGDPCMK